MILEIRNTARHSLSSEVLRQPNTDTRAPPHPFGTAEKRKGRGVGAALKNADFIIFQSLLLFFVFLLRLSSGPAFVSPSACLYRTGRSHRLANQPVVCAHISLFLAGGGSTRRSMPLLDMVVFFCSVPPKQRQNKNNNPFTRGGSLYAQHYNAQTLCPA